MVDGELVVGLCYGDSCVPVETEERTSQKSQVVKNVSSKKGSAPTGQDRWRRRRNQSDKRTQRFPILSALITSECLACVSFLFSWFP